MEDIKVFYFLGIKGVGMSPLAIIAKEAGYLVLGSDIKESFITQKSLSNIQILEGFKKENIDQLLQLADPKNILLVATAAHNGLENVEALYANSKGIKVVSQGQALGMFMDGQIFGRSGIIGVSICGSHGKTTTTAMLSSVMMQAGLDPSYVVGTGEVFPLGKPGHFGKGEYFITESDEYLSDLKHDRAPKFFYQKPKYIIANNLDFDHPDMYKDIEEIKEVFKKFFQENDSVIIANNDDSKLMNIITPLNKKVITYGKNNDSDYQLTGYDLTDDSPEIKVKCRNTEESYSLSIIGEHNALNALAVIAFCKEIKLDQQKLKNGLLTFKGSKRRLELVGKMTNGTLLYDDYAHHPNEIKATLKAIKEKYPQKTVTCVFQPHTFTRTMSLLNDFAKSFEDCDSLLLLPVFASAREEIPNEDISRQLFEAIQKENKPVIFMENHDSVVKYITTNSQDVILTLGAGDVYKIQEKLKRL